MNGEPALRPAAELTLVGAGADLDVMCWGGAVSGCIQSMWCGFFW